MHVFIRDAKHHRFSLFQKKQQDIVMIEKRHLTGQGGCTWDIVPGLQGCCFTASQGTVSQAEPHMRS